MAMAGEEGAMAGEEGAMAGLNLLPGKPRSRSEGETPLEEVENETTARRSGTAAESGAELKEGRGMEGEAPPTGTCRGHCRNRRRCGWWKRFSSELSCIRRIKKKVEKRPEEQQKYSGAEPQSQERRSNKRVWPKFSKSRNSLYQQREEVQREEVQGEAQNRLLRFFIRGRKRRPEEDTAAVGVAQTDAVQATVMVETSVEAAQDRAATESPGEPAAGELHVEVKEGRPETFQSVGQVDDITAGRPVEVFGGSADAGPSRHEDFLSSSKVTAELMMVFQNSSSSSLQASANGPFIQIELCSHEEVEEECWEGSSFSQNHLLLLHLLGFDHTEQWLLQTARTLVRAAVHAAVDQLTREQQSTANCVQQDHA